MATTDRSTTAARERALLAHYPPPAVPMAPSKHPVLWRCYGPVNGVRVDVPVGK